MSIPILNEAGIAQISPSNTAVGLTTNEPGATPGEPDKYYPTGQRTFARIVPKDTIQGAALATLMKEDGCTKVQLLNDKEVYGAGLARNIEASAKAQGLTDHLQRGDRQERGQLPLAGAEGQDRGAPTAWCSPASRPTTRRRCSRTSPRRCRPRSSTGPTASPTRRFASPKEGIPAEVADRTKVTIATLSPDQYPPQGQEFFKSYTQKYGEANPDPYAIYGYEAMELALDAIKRSKTGEQGRRRQGAVRDQGPRVGARRRTRSTPTATRR